MLGLRDPASDLLRGVHHCRSVLLLGEERAHLAENTAYRAIGKDRFQPVAYLDTVAPVADGKQDEDAIVLALLPNSPGAKERIRDIFDGLALKRRKRHQSDLCSGGPLRSGQILFQPTLGGGIDDAREIADIALRLERFPVDRSSGQSGEKQRGRQPQTLDHLEFSVYNAPDLDSLRDSLLK